MPLTTQQLQVGRGLYQLGINRGLSPQRAREFVAASYAESGLNPNARNPSGATGLFQLLSSGYQRKAQQLGGLTNPRANALAILPQYKAYWASHPGAAPGQGAAAVEASGQGAGFYAGPLKLLGGLGGGGQLSPTHTATNGLNGASVRPQGSYNPDARARLASFLINASQQTSQHQQPDYSGVYQLVNAIHSPTAPNPGMPIPVQAQGGSSTRVSAAVNLAKRFLGTPYVWGGESPKGFDCSGLLQYVWAKRGVAIPRTTYDQFKTGKPVNHLRPGDAVFFKGSDSKGGLPGHVGMYVGGGKFIEAPHTGAVVRISNLKGRSDYVGARRYR